MLNVEQKEAESSGPPRPLTYGDYMRVPELLQLQTPLGPPDARDEMLFIIVQQVQELWFKQILYELKSIIALLDEGDVMEGVRLLNRVNSIMRVVGEEVGILAAMPPQEFHRFRTVLASSSGFESEQFRELEFASGLRGHTFLKLLERLEYLERLRSQWPRSLHDAFCGMVAKIEPDVTMALVEIYGKSQLYPHLFMLAEALSEYEVLFGHWRFHHVKLVERAIGDNMPGTAGSTGAGYLGKTLGYRFFPELWAARNVLTRTSSP
jgi:tryptophan 2,3-dioxygenase